MEQDVEARLITFIRDIVLHGDPGGELDAATPLLEWGVLNSLSIALLLNFIRDDLSVMVPFEKVNAQNFRNVRSIATLIQSSEPQGVVQHDRVSRELQLLPPAPPAPGRPPHLSHKSSKIEPALSILAVTAAVPTGLGVRPGNERPATGHLGGAGSGQGWQAKQTKWRVLCIASLLLNVSVSRESSSSLRRSWVRYDAVRM